jgi:hypothetical protein
MCGPSLAGFRLDMRESGARRRIRYADEMIARRALNLPPGELGFALQRLVAVGTIEFEFVGIHGLYLHKRRRRQKSISKFLHTFCGQTALILVDERQQSRHES